MRDAIPSNYKIKQKSTLKKKTEDALHPVILNIYQRYTFMCANANMRVFAYA